MPEHPLPKGVRFERLREILVGWADAGAVTTPRYTSDVEDVVDVSDAVGRQTRFLEAIGVLVPDGQRHRLTPEGAALAAALAADDEDAARERLRERLDGWALTDAVRDAAPASEDDLEAAIADAAGRDLDTSRVRTGVETLLDCYAWAGLVERDGDTYRAAERDDRTDLDADALAALLAGGSTTTGQPAISLDIDVNPDDLEAIVAAVRAGLTEA